MNMLYSQNEEKTILAFKISFFVTKSQNAAGMRE